MHIETFAGRACSFCSFLAYTYLFLSIRRVTGWEAATAVKGIPIIVFIVA